MKMKHLKTLILATGLVLTTACSSNPVAPPPLPLPDCPHYQKLTDAELSLLGRCTREKEICQIHREALHKLHDNHQSANSCILQYKGIIEATR